MGSYFGAAGRRIAVLVNQAAYLLTGSKEGESVAEHANLEIVMWLLQEEPGRINELGRWQLKDAFEKAIKSCAGNPSRSKIGVYVDRSLLEKWQRTLPRPKDVEPAKAGHNVGIVGEGIIAKSTT